MRRLSLKEEESQSFVPARLEGVMRDAKEEELNTFVAAHLESTQEDAQEADELHFSTRPHKSRKVFSRDVHGLLRQPEEASREESTLPAVTPTKDDLNPAEGLLRAFSYLFASVDTNWEINTLGEYALEACRLEKDWGHLKAGTHIHVLAIDFNKNAFGFVISSDEAYMGSLRLALSECSIVRIDREEE